MVRLFIVELVLDCGFEFLEELLVFAGDVVGVLGLEVFVVNQSVVIVGVESLYEYEVLYVVDEQSQ